MNKDKEIAKMEKDVTSVARVASEYSITKESDKAIGSDLLFQIKELKKRIVAKKTEITGPMLESLAAVRSMFKPGEDECERATLAINAKLKAWDQAEEARIEAAKAKIEARVAKGTMRADTAIGKLNDVGEVSKNVTGAISKLQTRSVQKLDIFDESLIPREYCVPDREKVFTALKAGTVVPGAIIKIEKIYASGR
jgi:hypothetical protein